MSNLDIFIVTVWSICAVTYASLGLRRIRKGKSAQGWFWAAIAAANIVIYHLPSK